jgi:DNA polymerase III delta prime subunit
MEINTDATPAYRGYRLQALYTLSRILESESTEEYIFQPEGKEDLAVFDKNDNLIEVIQVKQRTHNLNLSSLDPNHKNSFFYRINNLAINPSTKIKLVTFGKVGSELLNAITKSGADRKRVAEKIAAYNFITQEETIGLLTVIELEEVEENKLHTNVHKILSGVPLGLDPDTAFESLLSWLYICAENKIRITRRTVIDKINSIGRFIRERAAHHQEWFSTIFPLEDEEIGDGKIYEQLSAEFYRGVSARYEHILVNLDVSRQEKIEEIKNAFDKSNIVILHGSSGQGKTALAYRYIKDFFPSQWRYQVRFIRNIEQAANIALAIASHAQIIEIPMIIYLDISPTDTDWIELLKILKSHRNIKILVTIREEDLRRTMISGAEIDFQMVELLFDQREAEKIYELLVKRNIPSHLLGFEDAWSKFGEAGPLLEFTYLVTQGKSLRERLNAQVQRLSEDVRQNLMSPEELSLLRLVAIASAFEARLQTKPLCKFLGLSSPESTIKRFEKEYLIRLSDNGRFIGGVHAIRSEILTELLTDNLFNTWVESAGCCLPYLAESDLDNFLLYCFSRHKNEIENPLDFISNYSPHTWQGFAGVAKSLVWLGISNYIEENKDVINKAFELFGSLWAYMLDFDLAEATNLNKNPWYENINLFPESVIQQAEELKAKQTDKTRIFKIAKKWLKNHVNSPKTPQSEQEWQGFADVILLVVKLKIALPIEDWITENNLNEAVETLSLRTLSELILAISLFKKHSLNEWLTNNRTKIVEKFRREQLWIDFQDNADEVSIKFLFDYSGDPQNLKNKPETDSSDNIVYTKTQQNLELLRNLFPHHKKYSTQGFGHLIWDDIFPYDD